MRPACRAAGAGTGSARSAGPGLDPGGSPGMRTDHPLPRWSRPLCCQRRLSRKRAPAWQVAHTCALRIQDAPSTRLQVRPGGARRPSPRRPGPGAARAACSATPCRTGSISGGSPRPAGWPPVQGPGVEGRAAGFRARRQWIWEASSPSGSATCAGSRVGVGGPARMERCCWLQQITAQHGMPQGLIGRGAACSSVRRRRAVSVPGCVKHDLLCAPQPCGSRQRRRLVPCTPLARALAWRVALRAGTGESVKGAHAGSGLDLLGRAAECGCCMCTGWRSNQVCGWARPLPSCCTLSPHTLLHGGRPGLLRAGPDP